jgi:2-oxoglutarate dehydrogenase E1 component
MKGELSVDEAETIAETFRDKMQAVYDEVHNNKNSHTLPFQPGFQGHWKGLSSHYSHAPANTGVAYDTLRSITQKISTIPEGFHINPKIARQFDQRIAAVQSRGSVDWGLAEALAFGSLLLEGTPVRLSGQDSRRGTFSQRHSNLIDGMSGDRYVPLSHLSENQAEICVYDSLLSEAAVLGFDYGYSLDEPNMLILWEAQFGDFANGAQVIIDQFIVSAESKWGRSSGLVMLLPHGYEGQGPEHSSARLERFLQLCAEDNIQVVYPSTPSQYFHLMRRQVKRNFRKPLIVMTPKSLLRHKAAVSPVDELVSGPFREVIDDPTAPERVRRVVLCSGKVYYDLLAYRQETKTTDVAILRLEQFYPWPGEMLRTIANRYRSATEWVWVQEESQNMGGWTFVAPRLAETLNVSFGYVGRDASASPATGSHHVHEHEQAELVKAAIGAEVTHLVSAARRPIAALTSKD